MEHSHPKRVLIVDDEPKVANSLAESLQSLASCHHVDIAYSADDALEKIQGGSYALVIADFTMPGMSGDELAAEVKHSSPQTRLVLMTDYGASGLRPDADVREVGDVLEKPISSAQVREIVVRAIGRTGELDPYRSGERALRRPVDYYLKELLGNTGSICALLLTTTGFPIEVSGPTADLDTPGIGALVAANFSASAELGKMLGSDSVFKSSYHEGQDFNIYAYVVNDDFLLAVIFKSTIKAGTVFFYTKQAAEALAPLLEEQPPEIDMGANLAEAIDESLEQLFEEESDADRLVSFQEALAAGYVSQDTGQSQTGDAEE